MKLNKKIDLIREELNKEIKPINALNILDSAHISPKVDNNVKNTYFTARLRTSLVTLLILAIVIPLAISLSKYRGSELDKSEQMYESVDEVFGFIATSAVALIYSSEDVFTDNNAFLVPNQDLLIYEELSTLNRFLSPIETMLSYNTNHFYRQPSDKRQYSNKIVYQGLGLLGEILDYQIYFNELIIDNKSFAIDCIVVLKDKTFVLKGKRQIVNSNTILEMTYYINENITKDYLQVSKNLNDSKESYNYKVVRNDIIINNSKLTLVQGEDNYATLENLLSPQKTTFSIYSSQTSKFSVEYEIKSDPISTDNNEDSNSYQETGSIIIDVNYNAAIFQITSNNQSDSVSFENAGK